MFYSKAARRYAKAIFDLAREQDRLKRVEEDFANIRELIDDSPDFARFLEHPLISSDERKGVLEHILKRRVESITFRFLLLLDEKRRLSHLREISEVFEDLVYEHKGVLRVRITSAAPLDEQQVRAIRDKLKSRFNKDIEPITAEDPDLIGGFKVQVGDAIYDSCIATRLETFKRQLTKA